MHCYNIYSGKNLLNYEIQSYRISGFFGEELILGSFILKILPIFFTFFLIMNNSLTKNISYIFYATIIFFGNFYHLFIR